MATTAIVEPMKQVMHIVWLLIRNALLQGVTSSNTTTSSSTITGNIVLPLAAVTPPAALALSPVVLTLPQQPPAIAPAVASPLGLWHSQLLHCQ